MENKPNTSLIRTAIYCFKYSLIIGTLIFLSYYISGINGIEVIGFFYLCAAVVINCIVLLILLLSLISATTNRSEIVKAMGLLLVNIPIAFLYFWVVTAFPHIF